MTISCRVRIGCACSDVEADVEVRLRVEVDDDDRQPRRQLVIAGAASSSAASVAAAVRAHGYRMRAARASADCCSGSGSAVSIAWSCAASASRSPAGTKCAQSRQRFARDLGVVDDGGDARDDGLDGRQAEAFVGGQERERARLTVQREQFIVADVGPQFDAIGHAQVADQRIEVLMRMRAVFADDDEPGVGKARGDAGERADQVIDVTAVEDRADRTARSASRAGGARPAAAACASRLMRSWATPSRVVAGSKKPPAPGAIARTRATSTSSQRMISSRENAVSVRTRRARWALAQVVSLRRRPSRPANHSGCAQNDTSWTDTTTGTRDKIGPE